MSSGRPQSKDLDEMLVVRVVRSLCVALTAMWPTHARVTRRYPTRRVFEPEELAG